MPALNFKARFAPLVEAGIKLQTIRARRNDGRDPRIGDKFYLYTGMRTARCRKLGEAICTERYPIIIELDGLHSAFVVVRLDGELIQGNALADLARRDGFSDTCELIEWFDNEHGLPFEGYLYRWEKTA